MQLFDRAEQAQESMGNLGEVGVSEAQIEINTRTEEIRRSLEHYLGYRSLFFFEDKSHFFDQERMISNSGGRLPNIILGEVRNDIFQDTTADPHDFDTSESRKKLGMNGSIDAASVHIQTVKYLFEHTNTCFMPTDGLMAVSEEQFERQEKALALEEPIVKLEKYMWLPPIISAEAILIWETKNVLRGSEIDRRMFLKIAAVASSGFAGSVLASRLRLSASIQPLASQLETNPEYLRFFDALVRVRNYVMVLSTYSVLSRLGESEEGKNQSVLFTIGGGHNQDKEGCASLFVLGPEHVKEEIKKYATLLINRTLQIAKKSSDSSAAATYCNQYIQTFSYPMPVNGKISNEPSTRVIPCAFSTVLTEMATYARDSSNSEVDRKIIAECIVTILDQYSRDCWTLLRYQKPYYIKHPEIDGIFALYYDRFKDMEVRNTISGVEQWTIPPKFIDAEQMLIGNQRIEWGYDGFVSTQIDGFIVIDGLPAVVIRYDKDNDGVMEKYLEHPDGYLIKLV